MSTPYDAWEAMYYIERGRREKHEVGVPINEVPHRPSLMIPLNEDEDIRTSLPNSIPAKEDDTSISEAFVNPDEVVQIPSSPLFSSPLDDCLTPNTYEAVIPTESTSPRTIDDVTQNEIIRQQQVNPLHLILIRYLLLSFFV